MKLWILLDKDTEPFVTAAATDYGMTSYKLIYP